MRLSTKGRYAVTAVLELALRKDRRPITLAEISETQGISLSYLEQLFAKLRRSGLVSGVRGPGGGYRLAKPAADISVAEVIHAVDETIDVMHDQGLKNDQDGELCLTQELWNELSNQLYGLLDGISLQSLIDKSDAAQAVLNATGSELSAA